MADETSGEVRDLVPELLRAIRDEIRATNTRIDGLRAEFHRRVEALERRSG